MPSPNALPHPMDVDQLSLRVQELRLSLQNKDPEILAALTGTHFQRAQAEKGRFSLVFLGREVCLNYPELVATAAETAQELPTYQQAMLLYYFCTGDGTPIQGRWISFSELPNGRFYQQAFQSYTGGELVNVLQNDLKGFERAAQNMGGERFSFGQAAYRFLALPRVPLLVAYWQGDEDFTASCQVLFDASASHYLPTDVCAILGRMLTQRLVKAYRIQASGSR